MHTDILFFDNYYSRITSNLEDFFLNTDDDGTEAPEEDIQILYNANLSNQIRVATRKAGSFAIRYLPRNCGEYIYIPLNDSGLCDRTTCSEVNISSLCDWPNPESYVLVSANTPDKTMTEGKIVLLGNGSGLEIYQNDQFGNPLETLNRFYFKALFTDYFSLLRCNVEFQPKLVSSIDGTVNGFLFNITTEHKVILGRPLVVKLVYQTTFSRFQKAFNDLDSSKLYLGGV
eukprot:snap_masked-scaffold_112-processed-gene-0.4-mRNA-1 protein AED:1.00 eAED:1.00 QI:0/0/0/0/1/1/2/0/229